MTNSPEALPDGAPPRPDGALTPASDAGEAAPAVEVAQVVEVEPTDAAPAEDQSAFDHGTYESLLEPRSPNRLELAQGVWHQVSPKYVRVQFIAIGIWLALVVVAIVVVAFFLHQSWVWIPGGIALVVFVWILAITPRQARSIGYQLRADDLVFRRGILWQRLVAVPYGRMQLVDITHGPLDRGFGIAQLKFVTAAAATGVVIPGLPQATAEMLRDHLVAVAESRRTGL